MGMQRFSPQLLRSIFRTFNTGSNFSTGTKFAKNGTAGRFSKSSALLISSVAAVGGGTFFYYHLQKRRDSFPLNIFETSAAKNLLSLQAATKAKGTPQANVYSQTKDHALYLSIHLNPSADPKQCAKAVANVAKYVDKVSPPDMRDENDEVWAGVGFGEDFYNKVSGSKRAPLPYNCPYRRGPLGEMPNTGGDIFIHAKSHSFGKLFELAQMIKSVLPKGAVVRFSDVYSFVYQNGRDLSGFLDGTENPADEDGRFDVAVNKQTGGSFCMTQRWVHDLDFINDSKTSTLEGFIGRQRDDSTELKKKLSTSHVARMTEGPAFNAKKPVQIVRQSMPYGSIGGEAGLFFIAFAESPKNFDFMLDRMVGATEDKLSDDTMRFSKCVSGNYWYFPSVEELKSLA